MPGAMDWIIATEPIESMSGRLCTVMHSIDDAVHKLQTNKWGVYSFVTVPYHEIAGSRFHKG